MNDARGGTHVYEAGAVINTNRGKVTVNQHYHGDYARYKSMDAEQLRVERADLAKKRSATYQAFMRHPTVPWFGGAMLVYAMGIAFIWGEQVSPLWASFILLWMFFAVAPSLWMMVRRRRALFDGLQILRTDLKLVEAFLAIREAEEAYGGA